MDAPEFRTDEEEPSSQHYSSYRIPSSGQKLAYPLEDEEVSRPDISDYFEKHAASRSYYLSILNHRGGPKKSPARLRESSSRPCPSCRQAQVVLFLTTPNNFHQGRLLITHNNIALPCPGTKQMPTTGVDISKYPIFALRSYLLQQYCHETGCRVEGGLVLIHASYRSDTDRLSSL